MKRTIFNLCTLLFLGLLLASGCTTTASSQPVSYQVGDLGPAGGLVFFDKGKASDGWRYLEAAPARTEVLAAWGKGSEAAKTDTSIGSGKTNTEMLFEANPTDSGSAPNVCAELTVKGYDDWFLPSKDELSLLFTNLARTGKETFRGEGYAYWSSSSYDEDRAWAQGFFTGVQGRVEKSELLVVRAIRAF